jgi:hypothetical protein
MGDDPQLGIHSRHLPQPTAGAQYRLVNWFAAVINHGLLRKGSIMKRLLWAALMCLGLTTVTTKAQDTTQQYAYLTYNADGSVTLNLVDPTSLQTTVLSSITVGVGENVGQAFLSPAGEWLAFTVTSADYRALRLFNLDIGQVIPVIDNFAFPRRPETSSIDFEVFAWAPDGSAFAFHFQSGEEAQSTYLYNLDTHMLFDLSRADTNQYQLSWSADSSRFALFSMSCEVEGCPRAAIDIFDGATGLLSSSIDIGAFAGNNGFERTNFCQLHWSPNSAYITFFSFCDDSAIGAAREIQIADVNTGSITSATQLTPTDIAPAVSAFRASVDVIWANNDTLLFGLDEIEGKLFAPSAVHSFQTLAYSIESQSTRSISQNRFGRWAPANDQLFGYIAYEYTDDPVRGMWVTDANVQIGLFDGQSLTTQSGGPSGCNLAWNNQDTVLAYVEMNWAAIPLCSPDYDKLSIIFLSNATMQRFTPQDTAFPLGWYRQT